MCRPRFGIAGKSTNQEIELPIAKTLASLKADRSSVGYVELELALRGVGVAHEDVRVLPAPRKLDSTPAGMSSAQGCRGVDFVWL